MGWDYVYVCSGFTIAVLIIFTGTVWIFTASATLNRILEAGDDTPQKLRILRGFLIAPFIALYDLAIRLSKYLLKVFLAILGVILVAFALLLSPFIGIVYLAYLAIRYGYQLGERLLQRAINFPD